MTNTYLIQKRAHETEVNSFPMVFAFSNKQFEEGMIRLGLAVTDTDKVFSIGAGGYIRKTDSDALSEMFNRHSEEKQDAIDNDLTGEGFVLDMFSYELANHEYGYTWDSESTLDALGLTIEEVMANTKLLNGFKKACKEIKEQESCFG